MYQQAARRASQAAGQKIGVEQIQRLESRRAAAASGPQREFAHKYRAQRPDDDCGQPCHCLFQIVELPGCPGDSFIAAYKACGKRPGRASSPYSD